MACRFWLVESGCCDPAFNMAFDHALLEAMPKLGVPVLRFYGWLAPAATFGYFQKYSEVEAATHLRPLIRRPTGGGIVPHDSDWTYCLVFPPSHAWYGLKAVESYRRIHEWIRASFAALGVPARLAPESLKTHAGACFAGHEQSDVLSGGRKIAGAAQRRTREGLLIQGSIQPPSQAPERGVWQGTFCLIGSQAEAAEWVRPREPDLPYGRADELAARVYSQPGYQRKR
jgi:lipoate-protein ligase A